ncbi:hypothetical protein GF359_08440 [candidate division WOR-3 bacterium]|uniref:Uncharacterized protein n=1 Tax=candidate division WOR-3 bacterium TaxID=2052148 RepID=A0A9D5KAA9_UNCW3|nr:hypothetical protein [candidate division WOR-3 bacterium]MBD3365228.1 hypothetical protein [candidate division WOR-3 bacterium]
MILSTDADKRRLNGGFLDQIYDHDELDKVDDLTIMTMKLLMSFPKSVECFEPPARGLPVFHIIQ